jgi:AAA+ superfamily predicted ATPase
MNIKNTDGFNAAIRTLTNAAVGVIIVQTREPHRTQQVLREFAFAQRKTFRVWDCVYGWRKFADTPNGKIEQDKILDAYAALKRIADLDGDGNQAWNDCLCAMHYPHWTLPKNMSFMQLIKHYVRLFSETEQRLVLLVPEGFEPPVEIANDVTLVDFPLPAPEELKDSLLAVMMAALPEGQHVEVFNDADIATLVNNACGMTQLEAENAFSQALVTNKDTWPNTPFDDFNSVLLECKTNVVKRSAVLEMMDPVSIDDVGGLDLYKTYTNERVHAFTESAKAFGVDVPKGILLVGPPGTGKSLTAKATAGVIRIPLIKLDIGKVFAGIVGESEGRIRSALKQIEAMAPCIAFLDEIDKGLGGAHQNGGDSGVSRRVLGTILTHMQECTAPIYWIFTANRVDALPPELVRKGRLDDVFCVSLPNIVERMEVLRIHLRKRKQNPDRIADLARVATESKGYVSAELESAVAQAVLAAFNRKVPVTADLIIAQLANMKPLSEAFKTDFDRMMVWAEDNARMTSTPQEEPSALKKAEGALPGKPGRRGINLGRSN